MVYTVKPRTLTFKPFLVYLLSLYINSLDADFPRGELVARITVNASDGAVLSSQFELLNEENETTLFRGTIMIYEVDFSVNFFL